MNISNIFDMARADKYTKDGREEIIKAQETEDRRYKTGEISEATGLQKQPDGSWAPPKGGAGSRTKKEAASPDTKRQTVVNFLMKKSQVPEESAKKAAEGLTPGLLNQMYNNIKKDHGDKYDAGTAANEAKRMEAYKKEGFSNLKKYDDQDAAEAEMWDYIKGTERTKADVDTIKLYKAPDGKYKWTDDPVKQKKLEGYGYEETQKSDWIKNQAKEAAKPAKKDVAAEQTARNEAMKAAENESQNAAVFNDLNEKAATEGIEYKIRKTKAGEYYWDKYRDGKHVGGGSARDMTDAVNRANKNFEEYIKENKPKKIEVPKNAGRGDYIKINGELVKVDYAQEGRYGSELGTLLQYEDPDTGKNRFVLQSKNGTAKDVTKEYLNGAYDSAPLTGDSRLNLSQVKDARRTYKIGEISEKTGLQKTANGWVEPKKGAGAGGATARVQQKRESGKHEAARKDAEIVNLTGKTPDQKRDIVFEKAKAANPKYAVKRWRGVDGKEHTVICEIKEAVGRGWQNNKEYKYYKDKETGNGFSAEKAENAKINKDGFLEYQYKMESGNIMNIEFTNTPPTGAEKSKYQTPGVARVPSSEALLKHLV